VAGCCECGDERSCSYAMELVRQLIFFKLIQPNINKDPVASNKSINNPADLVRSGLWTTLLETFGKTSFLRERLVCPNSSADTEQHNTNNVDVHPWPDRASNKGTVFVRPKTAQPLPILLVCINTDQYDNNLSLSDPRHKHEKVLTLWITT
jgi:hypothetical protein